MSFLTPKNRIPQGPALFGFFLLVTAVFFGAGMSVQFHYDDGTNIGSNAYVHSLQNFWLFFTDARTHSALPENSPYRPLMTLSHALMWALGDGSTLPFHLLKLVLHAANGCLLFWILRRILGQALEPTRQAAFQTQILAFLAALSFLLHPAQTESVNYISATNTLQSSFFVLAAFALYLKNWLPGMAVAIFLGLLTKEEGAAALPLILWHQLLLGKRPLSAKPTLWLLGTFGVFTLLYWQLSNTVQFSVVSRSSYFLTQLRAWIYYLRLLVWPYPLSIEKMSFGFSENLLSPGVLPALGFWLSTFVIGGVALWKTRARPSHRGVRMVVFFAGAYLAALSPASSFFPLSEPVNEHRYYLGYGFLIPLIWYGLAQLSVRWVPSRSRPTVQASFVLVTLVVLGGISLGSSRVWAQAETLWRNAIENDPGNGRLLNNLAVLYLNRGELDRALPLYERCVQESPHYLYCHPGLAATYQNLGRGEEALAEFRRAVVLYPGSVYARFAYARALWDLRQDQVAAREQLDACDEISARHYAACTELRKRIER